MKLYWISTVCGAATFCVLMFAVALSIGVSTGAFVGGGAAYLSDMAVIRCTLITVPLMTIWIWVTDHPVFHVIRHLPTSEIVKDGFGVALSAAGVGLIFFLPNATTGLSTNLATLAVGTACGFGGGLVRGWVYEAGGGNRPQPDPEVFS